MPEVVGRAVGDERNVLLTLARVLVTPETGRVVPKDAAARAVAPRLSGAARRSLTRAGTGYPGRIDDDWSGLSEQAEAAARTLAEPASRHG